jgi:hypothetical protein
MIVLHLPYIEKGGIHLEIGMISFSIFLISLLIAIVFAFMKKVKLMNRSALVMIGAFIVFVASVTNESTEVITSSVEISHVNDVDEYIDSIDFDKVFIEDKEIVVQLSWSKNANPKWEPKDAVEVNMLLDGISGIFQDHLEGKTSSMPVRLLYFEDGEKIGNKLIEID